VIQHCLMIPVIAATILAIAGGLVLAQDASPTQARGISDPAVQPLNDSGPTAVSQSQVEADDACKKDYLALRADAEKRGQLIRAASERHAPPEDVCRLITDYGQSEIAMIRYLESRVTICAIAAQMIEQSKSAHKTTEAMERKVCALTQKRGPPGPTGDF
jgi:hypothetical protein